MAKLRSDLVPSMLYCAFRDGLFTCLALLKRLFLLRMDWTRDLVNHG